MVDAIHAMVLQIRREQDNRPIDALALSLSSEFLARFAAQRPDFFRSLSFVSPTGFDRRAPYLEPPGTTRANPTLLRVLRFPLWDRGIFRLLTSRRSIRYFLEKTWGSKSIDEGMVDYDYLTTHQPGARFAPYHFVSGFLFSRDITRVYEALAMPVWLAHGVRGDFQDYSYAATIARRPNWTVSAFQTGALPHFERPEAFMAGFENFQASVPER
jgi:pimeloyl-ACP methyl ester carboxylesterase